MNEVWSLQKALKWTVDYFTSKQIPEPRLNAEMLLTHVLNCNRIELYVQFERLLSQEERAAYRTLIQRRARREPVQYILGETEFMGLPFRVTPDVLIPRPDTEHLVDHVVEYFREKKFYTPEILDIGTGSGCIAISLAHFFPAAKVSALEKSSEALKIARENAAKNDVEMTFIESDFFEQAPRLKKQFDVIVSNPPYISEKDWSTLAPEVAQYEPRTALFGGKDGLDFYRKLLPLVKTLLKKDGAIFLETGYDQAKIVGEMFAKAGFSIEIHKDYQQIERVLIAKKN